MVVGAIFWRFWIIITGEQLPIVFLHLTPFCRISVASPRHYLMSYRKSYVMCVVFVPMIIIVLVQYFQRWFMVFERLINEVDRNGFKSLPWWKKILFIFVVVPLRILLTYWMTLDCWVYIYTAFESGALISVCPRYSFCTSAPFLLDPCIRALAII